MLSLLYASLSYFVILISVPFIINSINLAVLTPPILAKFFYFYQIEPITLCLSFVTFYAYVFLGFLKDVFQHHYYNQGLYLKFERGAREVQKLYPRKYYTIVIFDCQR